jgi:CheY-like chemotaxis protein
VVDLASVHQLRPVRVLVVGADPTFVRRATDALSLLGFDVMSTTTASRAAELAALQRVNVVLLDATSGVAAAASAASAIDGLPHRVEVLLAGNGSHGTRRLGYDVVKATASGEELAAAVHRAYHDGPWRSRRSIH